MKDERDDAAALRHPLWWIALALLILNDHVLKGAGLLPGWLTGKLSDFAGMIVAPALAASLISLQHKRLRSAAFLSVALLFAITKLSPEARDALVSLASRLGMRWRIVVDPTDLVALVALPFSWSLTAPAGRRRVALQRSAMALGGVACMATSQPAPAPLTQPIEAQVVLANRLSERVEIGIRFSDALFDCGAAQVSPGTLLSRSLFHDEMLRVALDPGERFPLDPVSVQAMTVRNGTQITLPTARGLCTAVLLTGESMSETVVLWPSSLPRRPVDATESTGADALTAGVFLRDEGGLRRVRALSNAVSAQPLASELARCDRRGVRYSWSLPLPPRPAVLRAITELPGGCLSLTLREGDAEAFEWFVCVPREAVPFMEGERIEFIEETGLTGGAVRIQSPMSRVSVRRDAFIEAGQPLPGIPAPVSFGTLCGGHRDQCGAYSLPRSVSVGSAAPVVPGEGEVTLFNGSIVRFGRAEHVLATRSTCAPALRALGVAVDYAVTTRGL